ncbi:MAG: metalloregulator ArsR/SmtB family transcription factor [Eubacteriales bacterium]|nr:metalloregulator ArsR/SmtB family transcription factor [Eubacteriales bacterium]MDD4513172.1 metalloregulator ArsR/SmtB family transcription factor [Eubacteriales bacterium]
MELCRSAELFKALGDETRLKILQMLSPEGSEACACKMLHAFDCTQPTLCYHLKYLSDAGLILSRREGCQVYYRANTEMLRLVMEIASISNEKSSD